MTKRSDTPDGGAAFPLAPIVGNLAMDQDRHGMTLRDYFAAAALQGFIASFAHPNGSLPRPSNNAELPEYAYEYADLMLKARLK